MKKYLPIILIVLGLGILTAVFFVFRGKTQPSDVEDTSAVIEISPDKRPIASLTPSKDGYWLKLEITKLVVEAASLDYELLYKLPDGRTQGVPGTIKLKGQSSIERDLLLGSESSGNFRYDEGVEEGKLTLRLRNEKGRLMAKFSTDFNLQSATKKLTTVDGDFTASLAATSNAFFITMETFGYPGEVEDQITSGPFGIFTSAVSSLDGTVDLVGDAIQWSGSRWSDSFDTATGIFLGISE